MNILIFANQGLGDLIMMSPSIKYVINNKKNNVSIVVKSNIEKRYLKSYFNEIKIISLRINNNYKIINLINLIISIIYLKFKNYDIVIAPFVSSKKLNLYLFKFLNFRKIYTKNNFSIKGHIQISYSKERMHQVDFYREFFSCALGIDIAKENHELKRMLLKIDDWSKPIRIAIGPGCGIYEKFKVINPLVISDAINLLNKKRNLNFDIYIYGTSTDRPTIDTLYESLKKFNPKLLINYEIDQIVEILNQCHAVITGTTGPGHIASLSNARILCISGPTNPTESGPYSLFVRHLRHTGFECSPCYSEDFLRGCGKFDCMSKINPEVLANSLYDLLNDKFNFLNLKTKYLRIPIFEINEK